MPTVSYKLPRWINAKLSLFDAKSRLLCRVAVGHTKITNKQIDISFFSNYGLALSQNYDIASLLFARTLEMLGLKYLVRKTDAERITNDTEKHFLYNSGILTMNGNTRTTDK